jgi:hypothetical protein
MTDDRTTRLAELNRQINALYADLRSLTAERSRLLSEQAREEWPDGPFTLHWWRYHGQMSDTYDEPLAAVRMARHIEDTGEGSTERITDRHGVTIYDLSSYPPKRVADGYPEVPDDL